MKINGIDKLLGMFKNIKAFGFIIPGLTFSHSGGSENYLYP